MSQNSNIRALRMDWEQATRGGQIGSWPKYLIFGFLGLNHGWSFVFWLRMAQSSNPLVSIPSKVIHKIFGKILNIAISSHTKIGGGLHLGDAMCMVVNPNTKIGCNCHLSQFLNIGTNHDTPAVIGDNVYIGPHVCIVEGVHIGDNVTIGAGSVVTKDIPDNATVAGVPARVLNYKNPARYIYFSKENTNE